MDQVMEEDENNYDNVDGLLKPKRKGRDGQGA